MTPISHRSRPTNRIPSHVTSQLPNQSHNFPHDVTTVCANQVTAEVTSEACGRQLYESQQDHLREAAAALRDVAATIVRKHRKENKSTVRWCQKWDFWRRWRCEGSGSDGLVLLIMVVLGVRDKIVTINVLLQND